MFDRDKRISIRNSRLLSFFSTPSRISDSLVSRYRIQDSENAALPLSSVSENVIGLIGVGRSNVWPVVGHVFGATVQLSAATRDFPVHGHLHASQTPKGCSFTRPPSAGRMGGWHEILPVAWVKSRDGGWREEGAAGGLESDGAQVPKQTYDLNGSNRFLVGNLPWKIDTKLCRVEGQRRGELWSSTSTILQPVDSQILVIFSTPARPGFVVPFLYRIEPRFDSTIIDVKRSVFLRVEIFFTILTIFTWINKLWLICTSSIQRQI